MTKRINTEEIWCSRMQMRESSAPEEYYIYGKAYIPSGTGRYPLVIFSHELGKNHEAGIPYAERLADSGYAVYTFDYCGGTVFCNRAGEIVRSRHSSGETTDASLLTWIEDLTAVVSSAKTWEFVDPGKIFLAGGSQGAVSSALTAVCQDGQFECSGSVPPLARVELQAVSLNQTRRSGGYNLPLRATIHGDAQEPGIAGLILLYPPLDLPERMHKLFHTRDQIPETFDLFDGWITLGRRYAGDIWDFDVYGVLAAYEKPVLILHGDRDDIVDISVSERAVNMIPDCHFYRISEGRHGFKGRALEEAGSRIIDFLRDVIK